MWHQAFIRTTSTNKNAPNRNRTKLGSPYIRDISIECISGNVRLRILSGGKVIFPRVLSLDGDNVSDATIFTQNEGWYSGTGGELMTYFYNLWAKIEHPYELEIQHFITSGGSVSRIYFNTAKEPAERTIITIDPYDDDGQQ